MLPGCMQVDFTTEDLPAVTRVTMNVRSNGCFAESPCCNMVRSHCCCGAELGSMPAAAEAACAASMHPAGWLCSLPAAAAQLHVKLVCILGATQLFHTCPDRLDCCRA